MPIELVIELSFIVLALVGRRLPVVTDVVSPVVARVEADEVDIVTNSDAVGRILLNIDGGDVPAGVDVASKCVSVWEYPLEEDGGIDVPMSMWVLVGDCLLVSVL